MSKKILLIDGSSFLFRAYHGVPGLSNAEGLPTNAIFGVANMLRRLNKDHQTDYFTVVFDAKGPTFRHEFYPDYKANRPEMPEDLRVQIAPLHDLIRAMGFPLIMHSGVEADDVLAELTGVAVAAGFEVVISTGDKDMAQLVTDNVTLENTMSNTRLDVQGVIDKFSVRPEQIVDYLALMGDSSDNIPGVPKVGKKRAAEWLAKYGTIENLLQHADEIKGKVGESLRDNVDLLLLSQHLTQIKHPLELGYEIEDLRCQAVDTHELYRQVTALGFSSWAKQLFSRLEVPGVLKKNTPTAADIVKTIVNPVKIQPSEYELILTWKHFEVWLDKLKNARLFVFNIETTSLDYSDAEIVGISFAVVLGEAAYLPLGHDYLGVETQLLRDKVLQTLKPLLESNEHKKLGHNLKYDTNVLANYAIYLQGIAHDTMLESYILESTRTKHNIYKLAKIYLKRIPIHYEDMTGKGVKQINFSKVNLEQACEYAAEGAEITLALHETLWKKLSQHPVLVNLYQSIELPIAQVLSSIERNGILIDSDMLAKQSMELANFIMVLEQQAHDLAGQNFNISSPKQIQEILFEQMGLPVLKKTPKGQASTAESVLQKLAEDYPLPALILKHRSLSKLKQTYTDKLPLQVNGKTGRIHTSYHQAEVITGRLSSIKPNVQNIPVRTEYGRKIRQTFIAPEGFKIVAADYSQIELRIMAHMSGDKGLLKAFKNHEDIHKATAAEVFSVELEQVTTDLRRSAKTINFGLIYGMSAFGLAKKLGVRREVAQDYINLYFSRYPDILRYMEESRELAKQQGYVETLWGRRIYMPDINSAQKINRENAERTAINAPIQGTAADIIKRAMISIHGWLQDQNAETKMIMQVHDELVFEVIDHAVINDSRVIKRLMSDAALLDIPLVVDVGVGLNWDEAH